MAKTKISEYDATAGNNTDINSINIDEGCSPSGINNAIRALMSHLKAWQGGTSGDSLPVASGGTGASTAGTARTNLSAAASGANSDITSITGLTTALTVAQGGTGVATHTSKGVLIGNGTSAVTTVSPGTSGNVLTSDGTSWTSSAGAYALTSGTVTASTSGSTIDYTSIPSWVKRITVMFSAVSTSGSSYPLIQIGTSGGLQNTGYVSDCGGTVTGSGALAGPNATTGYIVFNAGNASASLTGSVVLNLVDSATGLWVANGVARWTSQGVGYNGGTKTLSGTLDRIRITTVNGTDTFDAGSINILYE